MIKNRGIHYSGFYRYEIPRFSHKNRGISNHGNQRFPKPRFHDKEPRYSLQRFLPV